MKKAIDNAEKPIVADEVPLTVIPQVPATPLSTPVQNALLIESVPPRPAAVKTIKALKPKNVKEQVSIKASDYAVGMLGGISNLQIRLFNSSPQKLDKVTLAIQYLKPNGNVVATDQYEMYSIKPFSSATLAIPDSKRGVKIKYRVVDISSKETKEI